MPKPKAEYSIRVYHDKPVTKKEFHAHRQKEIRKEYISRQEILRSGELSRHQLDALAKRGEVKSIRYRGKKYFSKEDIRKVLCAQQKKLF